MVVDFEIGPRFGKKPTIWDQPSIGVLHIYIDEQQQYNDRWLLNAEHQYCIKFRFVYNLLFNFQKLLYLFDTNSCLYILAFLCGDPWVVCRRVVDDQGPQHKPQACKHTCTCRTQDKVRIFVSKMPISSPNPMFDHLLESSP